MFDRERCKYRYSKGLQIVDELCLCCMASKGIQYGIKNLSLPTGSMVGFCVRACWSFMGAFYGSL